MGLVLISCTVYGQTNYTPLIKEDKVWVERNTFKNLEDIRPPRVSYYFAFFSGDTLINEQTYHKLYHQNFYVEDWYNRQAIKMIHDTLQQPIVVALIREDTINQQVFHYEPDEQEYLIYDFSIRSWGYPLFY